MTALVHLSDPHFGTERAPVVDALVACVRRIAPELVVISGDITQRATRAQFATARAFADRLGPAARLVIPGNHDVPLFDLLTRWRSPYTRHQRVFGRDLEPVYRSDDWLVVGVKTTRRWRHKHGEVSAGQIARVAAALRGATARQLRVVVVHQPVAVPRADDAIDLLRGHEAAVRAWAAAGADVIAGGHIHLPYVLPLHDVHHGLARRAWCMQAGTAVSSRVRPEADNSLNVLHHGTGRSDAVVERWDYDAGRQRFLPVARHRLALDRGGPPRQAQPSQSQPRQSQPPQSQSQPPQSQSQPPQSQSPQSQSPQPPPEQGAWTTT